MVKQHHVLIVTFPAQGHINPALQFAKSLLRLGVHVTFSTSIYAHRRMTKTTTPPTLDPLSFAPFSDGFDDGLKPGHDPRHYMSELRRQSSQTLPQIIETSAKNGQPITFLVYSLLLPWMADVARNSLIPSGLLWIQPATILDIYYYYFNDYGDVINNPSLSIELPGLPLLTRRDLPSHFVSTPFALPSFKEHIEKLCEETNPMVLVNTFDDLEPDALRAIDKLNLIAIGPLIPSAFLNGKDPSDNSFGGDLFQSHPRNYMEWLNSKAESSVIYVSFGSTSVLKKGQTEEIVRGLLDSRRPFLWVIREDEEKQKEDEEKEKLSRIEELEKEGMIVPWCSQVEVLSHPSVGCFVTHCGWNSSMESLVSGVPMVAFPQWADQPTNAKLIEGVWKTGVRLAVNEEGIVDGDEVKKCLEMVMGGGESGEEMTRNAKKWKELAREAVKEGGSSDKNLRAFVDEVMEGL